MSAPSDLYQRRMVQITKMGLSPHQTIAECIASLAVGMDQLHDEIQEVKDQLRKLSS